jgi:NDP-sugar pyrophosphorylase family protein
MINIVVPMAGLGSRFEGTGEVSPKPLIEVFPGTRMIDLVVEYLSVREPHQFIFVCLGAHTEAHGYLRTLAPPAGRSEVVVTESVTRGPAMTALLARNLIDNGDELLVAYCDLFLDIDVLAFIHALRQSGAAGGLLTYPSTSAAESYAQLAADGTVLRTAEKQVISPDATAGLYYFRHGRDFVAGTVAMAAASPSGPELFVAPVYNQLIARGQHVRSYPISRSRRIEMGTPADLAEARAWFARNRPAGVAAAQ